MKIPPFRGVFMRDTLPHKGPWKRESAIINLDDARGPGTHWVAYRKDVHHVTYFDSFGNLQPPEEITQYLGEGSVIQYNHQTYQDFNSYRCGHLCLDFLTSYKRA